MPCYSVLLHFYPKDNHAISTTTPNPLPNNTILLVSDFINSPSLTINSPSHPINSPSLTINSPSHPINSPSNPILSQSLPYNAIRHPSHFFDFLFQAL